MRRRKLFTALGALSVSAAARLATGGKVMHLGRLARHRSPGRTPTSLAELSRQCTNPGDDKPTPRK